MKRQRHNLKIFFARISYLPRAFTLIWTAARRWTIAWTALLIVRGLLPIVTVYLTRAVVDNLVVTLDTGGGWETLQPTLILVGVIIAALLLNEALGSAVGWVRTAQAEFIQDHISVLIHNQAAALDLGFYDTPKYYDQLYRAQVDSFNQPAVLVENLGSLLQNSITLIAMAGVLIPFGKWLPLALIISTAPALNVAMRFTLRQHEWRLQNTTAIRRTRYYDMMITWRDAAAELRLFSLSAHFQTAFQKLRRRLRTERVGLARDQALAEMIAGAIALFITGLTLAWMLWRGVQGQVTLGDLALFYQAFNQGQYMLRALLASVGKIYSNSLFIENLFEFLSLQPKITESLNPISPPTTLRTGIRFHEVTFTYPGSNHMALDNFTLEIPAGQIAAIVGENGAGKSTLIKLLCRFYDPDQGLVTLDDSDLRDFPLADLRRLITVLFQDPVHYHDTAAKNIAFGNLSAEPSKADIEAAAQAAGADVPIARLSRGYETVLGKWFGEEELSVGEWQRLALARAFLRQAPILMLDEPTSAMDSWAEADWLERFRELVGRRTALLITHRFTTAMSADIIHVMGRGRIIESGTHKELIALQGRYAQSWRQQMRQTQNETPLQPS